MAKSKKTSLKKSQLSKVETLFNESPLCRSCGCLMTIAYNLPNSVTKQHNSPKYYPGYSEDTTIWCHRCNQNDAKWKQDNKIFSLKECLNSENNSHQLDGNYVVDGEVYYFIFGKFIDKFPLLEWKFEALRRWISLRIDGSNLGKLGFDEYLNYSLKGWYTLKHFYMGGGWYAYKQNPKRVKHWRFITREQELEEEEELFWFNLMICQIH